MVEAPQQHYVIALIKPFKLDDVKEALQEIGIHTITVMEAKAFGHPVEGDKFQAADYIVDYLPRVRLEFVAEQGKTEQAVETLKKAAATGRAQGDGEVIVLPVVSYQMRMIVFNAQTADQPNARVLGGLFPRQALWPIH
eukprot:m.345687 g.345687  ORF g.345687 m.345687 type:complete len:139 (-) comp27020_c0_seq1:959-1375(-)